MIMIIMLLWRSAIMVCSKYFESLHDLNGTVISIDYLTNLFWRSLICVYSYNEYTTMIINYFSCYLMGIVTLASVSDLNSKT